MNPEQIVDIVMELAALPFFPPAAEQSARLAIVRMVGAMAANAEQVRWLVGVMTSGIYAKWEGPAELRAVFCMKFRPKDAIECISAVHPEGLSREQLNPGKRMEIAAPAPLQIAGDVLTDDPEMLPLTQKIAERVFRMLPDARVDVTIRHEENDLQALLRSVDGFRADREAQHSRATTEAEIAMMVQLQDAARKQPKGIDCRS